MIHSRHKLTLIRNDVEDTNLNLVSSVPSLENIRSLVTSKNMSHVQLLIKNRIFGKKPNIRFFTEY
jgi:hypothetical protein